MEAEKLNSKATKACVNRSSIVFSYTNSWQLKISDDGQTCFLSANYR